MALRIVPGFPLVRKPKTPRASVLHRGLAATALLALLASALCPTVGAVAFWPDTRDVPCALEMCVAMDPSGGGDDGNGMCTTVKDDDGGSGGSGDGAGDDNGDGGGDSGGTDDGSDGSCDGTD